MAEKTEFLQAIDDAILDADSLERFINGSDSETVLTRLSAEYPTLQKAIKTMFENGGLPATVYDNKSQMMLGSSSHNQGDYAYVSNDDDSELNGFYKYDGVNWEQHQKTAEEYSKREVEKQIDGYISHIDDDNIAFSFVDDSYRVGVTIDKQANINASNIYNASHTYAFAWVDENNVLALAITKDGDLRSPTITKIEGAIDSLNTKLEGIETGKGEADYSFNKTDYMHVVTYGQSLSRGVSSTPVISNSQPYNNKMLSSGVLRRAMETGYDGSYFKPLVEEAISNEGETPTSAMLNRFVDMQVAKGDDAQTWSMVGTAPGRAGKRIAELSKGTGDYNGMLTQISDAYAVSQADGKSYSVLSMTWTQGENDYTPNNSQEYYVGALRQLLEDFTNDVKNITHQENTPLIIEYQTAAHRRYQRDTMQIALAQLQAHNEIDAVIMACPIYNLKHNTDFLHLTNESSYQLGRYYAKALDYTLSKGEKWQPLKPVSVTSQGVVIDITFNKHGLVFDSDTVAQTHNNGFDIWHDGELVDIITSTIVSDKNRVRVVLSEQAPDGAVISYARGRVGDLERAGNIYGPRGNLRDNAGEDDNYIGKDSKTYYMHNWCVMFELNI